MDPAIEAVLEKACGTDNGRVKADFALQDLNKVASAYADEQLRPDAEQILEGWAAGSGGELRKGIAMAFLAQARHALSGGARAAASAVQHVEGKIGDVGAAAGTKLAQSPLNRDALARAKLAGGLKAQEGIRTRFQAKAAQAPTQGQSIRYGAANPDVGNNFGGVTRLQPVSSALTTTPGGLGHAGVAGNGVHEHAEAMSQAFKAGAAMAGQRHAAQAARIGRVASKHAFRAGLAIAGVGAAGAGIRGALSQKQHDQRVEAGKHSHQGAGAGA